MIIGPIPRLILYILAGICPIWSEFVAVSSDYSLRGLLRPILASVSVAVVVMLARTRNPLVDGEPPTKVEVTNKPSNPVPTEESKPTQSEP
jgi:hypothetical protein